MCARLFALLVGFPIVLVFFLPAAVAADTPGAIWIASLDNGRTIAEARRTGAEILDRFPDALVLASEESVELLRAARFPVEGPVDLGRGDPLFLVRERGETGRSGPIESILTRWEGIDLIWSDGRNAIVRASGEPPHDQGGAFLAAKKMRRTPVRAPIVERAPAPRKAATTTFSPLVDAMVAEVDSAPYMQWIGNLAGANEITISGYPFTINNRWTHHARCDTAERYVYEQFLAMGIDSVVFDTFDVAASTARNVVATIPGAVTPERVYILCGHVDAISQSPSVTAPGANDNASGAAAVLTAAEILKCYSFHSTITLITFTGEEQGLYGSEHYAAEAAARGDSILGVVNCDMVAWYNNQYKMIIEGETEWDWLMQVANDACAEYTSLQTQLDYYSWGSDHVPFQNEGFPAFLAIEKEWSSYPCYHNTCDTTENNKGDFGADVTRACLATVAQLADPISSLVSVAEGGAPRRTRLLSNRPNPFNPSTTIRFTLDRPATADLSVFDPAGRPVRVLVRGHLGAGDHEVLWDGLDGSGRPAPSGVYLYRLWTGDRTIREKMLLVR